MLRARLPLLQALDTAAEQCTNTRLQHVVRQVRQDVHRGRSLSDSLARHRLIFSPLYVHLTRIGEAAGVLDQLLLRLAVHLEKTATLHRKVRFALFYPGLIVTVAVATVVFFLTVVVPTFAEMYADFGRPLPGPTRLVLSLSTALTDHAPWLALGGVLVTLGLALGLRTAKGRQAWGRLQLRLPGLGGMLRKSLAARFCRNLGTLLAAGIPLVEALSMLAASVGNPYVEHVLAGVVRRVRRGSSLYRPLRHTGLFPGLVVHLIAVGEETAELDEVLLHAAAHYEEDVDALLDALTAILEPVLIVLIGMLLGSILIALYLPLFELIHTIG